MERLDAEPWYFAWQRSSVTVSRLSPTGLPLSSIFFVSSILNLTDANAGEWSPWVLLIAVPTLSFNLTIVQIFYIYFLRFRFGVRVNHHLYVICNPRLSGPSSGAIDTLLLRS